MEIEIWLDVAEAAPGDLPLIEKRFRDWYTDGAEVRYGRSAFSSLAELGSPYRYRVDLGQAEALTAVRDLHARLHRHGVKVFIHFYY